MSLLQRLLAKATPRPWMPASEGATHLITENFDYKCIVDVPIPNEMSDDEGVANRDLITTLVNHAAAIQAFYDAPDPEPKFSGYPYRGDDDAALDPNESAEHIAWRERQAKRDALRDLCGTEGGV